MKALSQIKSRRTVIFLIYLQGQRRVFLLHIVQKLLPCSVRTIICRYKDPCDEMIRDADKTPDFSLYFTDINFSL